MPLAVFHAQHILFAGLGGRLWTRRVERVLGDDAALLDHEGPTASGSNAWAVGGGRTASGMPLIGGDPHRVIESPGVYQQIRLACDEFDVVGFAFPGVPGTPHFAHAGDVAWAITNAMADYQDLSDDPADPEFEEGLRLRNASTVLGDLGFEALLPLLRVPHRRRRRPGAGPLGRAGQQRGDRRPARHGALPARGPGAGARRHGLDRLAGRRPSRGDRPRRPGRHRQRAARPAERRGRLRRSRRPTGPAACTELLEGRTGLTPEDFRTFHNDTLLQPAEQLRRLVPGEFDALGLPDGRRLPDRRGLRRLALCARTPDRRRAGVRAAPRAASTRRCSRPGST